MKVLDVTGAEYGIGVLPLEYIDTTLDILAVLLNAQNGIGLHWCPMPGAKSESLPLAEMYSRFSE